MDRPKSQNHLRKRIGTLVDTLVCKLSHRNPSLVNPMVTKVKINVIKLLFLKGFR